MTMGASSAVEQALALARAPALLTALRQRPLPGDLPALFRLAARDEDVLAHWAAATGEEPKRLVDAAVFFLQQVLFAAGNDSYRVLGATAEASDDTLREHYRLLMRWLHPDRNPDEWDAIYADRVNRAWQDLRTPDKRRDYDQRRVAAVGPLPARRSGEFAARPPLPGERPVLSSRTVRHLPVLVLGGLGGLAALVLGTAWHLQQEEAGALATVPVAQPVAMAEPLVAPASAPPLAIELPPTPERTAVVSPETHPEPLPVVEIAAPEARSSALRPAVTDTVAAEVPVAIKQVLAESPRKTVPAAPEMRDVPDLPQAGMAVAKAAPAAETSPSTSAVEASNATKPVAPRVKAMPMAPAPELVSEAGEPAARQVAARFQAAYARGDLPALMALFTRDARNNRGGLDTIASDYRALFNDTDTRRIDLSGLVWLPEGEQGSLLARYSVLSLKRGKLRPRSIEGDIRFDLRVEDGVLRIQRLLHK